MSSVSQSALAPADVPHVPYAHARLQTLPAVPSLLSSATYLHHLHRTLNLHLTPPSTSPREPYRQASSPHPISLLISISRRAVQHALPDARYPIPVLWLTIKSAIASRSSSPAIFGLRLGWSSRASGAYLHRASITSASIAHLDSSPYRVSTHLRRAYRLDHVGLGYSLSIIPLSTSPFPSPSISISGAWRPSVRLPASCS
jgi:hypothetical protein